MSKLKILELFGGIGACSNALKRLNIDFEIADYVEIDKYAVKSYNAIYNTNFEPQDIRNWDKDIEVDLIMHGSPCQDFSIAGRQAGGDEESGTRSSLMYETVRIVDKLRPRYIIWENVKNILSKKHRHNFDSYISKLENLGYKSYYQVLNAKDYGVPQNRERVFTISIRNDINQDFEFPPKQELKLKLKDLLEPEVDEKYYLSEETVSKLMWHNERFKNTGYLFKPKTSEDKVANCITCNFRGTATDNFIKCIGSLDIKGNDQIKRVYSKEGISPTLTNMQGGNRQPKVLCSNKSYIERKYDNFISKKGYMPEMFNPYNESEIKEIAPTQTSECYKKESSAAVLICASRGRNPENPSDRTPSIQTEQRLEINTKGVSNTITTVLKDNYCIIGDMQSHASVNTKGICPTLTSSMGTGGGHVPMHNYDFRIRKLTPKECWRLMGFSDKDFEKAEKVNSNTQLYKQAGNSIVVNVLESILKNLV